MLYQIAGIFFRLVFFFRSIRDTTRTILGRVKILKRKFSQNFHDYFDFSLLIMYVFDICRRGIKTVGGERFLASQTQIYFSF